MSVVDTARSGLRSTQRTATRTAARQMSGVASYGLRKWIEREADEFTHDEYSSNPIVRAGQGGGDVINVMLVIVIAAVIGYVGIKATSETEGAIDVEDNSQFDNASGSLTDGFTSAMDLVEVVFIVLMLGVIIAVLVGLRRRRS